MSKDFEYDYIEPTQEHVGQMVEVSDSDTAWRERRLRHVFTDGIGILLFAKTLLTPITYARGSLPASAFACRMPNAKLVAESKLATGCV